MHTLITVMGMQDTSSSIRDSHSNNNDWNVYQSEHGVEYPSLEAYAFLQTDTESHTQPVITSCPSRRPGAYRQRHLVGRVDGLLGHGHCRLREGGYLVPHLQGLFQKLCSSEHRQTFRVSQCERESVRWAMCSRQGFEPPSPPISSPLPWPRRDTPVLHIHITPSAFQENLSQSGRTISLGLLGVDHVARENHLHGLGLADGSDEALRPPTPCGPPHTPPPIDYA